MRFATYLVAGGASRLDGFCVVPAAVELPLLVKVDEIDEQLLADGAREAVGMPAAVGAGPRGADANVPGVDGARTLQSDESKCYCPLLAINASLGKKGARKNSDLHMVQCIPFIRSTDIRPSRIWPILWWSQPPETAYTLGIPL